MLQEEYGIDFTHYKPSTVTRRIERRLALARSADIDEYVRRLKSDRGELDVLYRDLLIGVTRFFRDEQAFQVLESQVLPDLLARQPREAPLRALGRRLRDGRGGLLAGHPAGGPDGDAGRAAGQDLRDRRAPRLARARHARPSTTQEALADVSPERLARYFTRIGERYQVVPELRQRIVFAQHNVIKDAPFTRVDLVTCRNLLIYLQPAAQQKVLSLFHFALNRNGFLFLGPSETVGPLAARLRDARQALARLPKAERRPHSGRRALAAAVDGPHRPAPLSTRGGTLLALPAPRHLRRAPRARRCRPSLLVNERGELVHAFGGAGALPAPARRPPGARRPRAGGPRAEDGPGRRAQAGRRRAGGDRLPRRPDLRTGRRAASTRSPSSASAAAAAERPTCWSRSSRRSRRAAAKPQSETEVEMDQVSRDQLRALEAELAHTKESLQSAIEELETSNEELQASQRRAPDEQRGAPEHERRAPERQRGALHGQRRVPAQDRRADRADERHGQPPRQHGDRDHLPRRASSRSGSSRRRSPRPSTWSRTTWGGASRPSCTR